MIARILAAGAALVLGISAASAALVEEVATLAVDIDVAGKPRLRQPITVTIFRDDTRVKAPFLVLNHGRAGRPDEREKLGRARYAGNAKYFVERGFVVFIPTRIGYGVTGGPDLEDSGRCDARDFPSAFEAAAQQVLAVIRHAKSQAYVDVGRGLLVGQSFGGATALAVAVKSEPGVMAAINFSGGSGGRPKTHPGKPCRSDGLAATLKSYAKARVPTLWLYSQNDQYWGAQLPKLWFEGFVRNGGRGRFVELPPSGEDGHSSFSRNAAAWKPAVEVFLREVGMAGS
jgi:dienelactone hydrolase